MSLDYLSTDDLARAYLALCLEVEEVPAGDIYNSLEALLSTLQHTEEEQ